MSTMSASTIHWDGDNWVIRSRDLGSAVVNELPVELSQWQRGTLMSSHSVMIMDDGSASVFYERGALDSKRVGDFPAGTFLFDHWPLWLVEHEDTGKQRQVRAENGRQALVIGNSFAGPGNYRVVQTPVEQE